jgi:serine/threonine protein kinase
MEKFIKQKLIGTGAFGQAWLVQSKADGTKLVMKEIKIAKVSFTYLNNYFTSCYLNRWLKKNVMMQGKKYIIHKKIFF